MILLEVSCSFNVFMLICPPTLMHLDNYSGEGIVNFDVIFICLMGYGSIFSIYSAREKNIELRLYDP